VAAAILGAILVGRYIRTGTAPASDASTEDESSVVSLDLRSGPSRGAGTMPTLALAGAVGEVNLRLSAPINSTATYEMEVRAPQGKVMTSTRETFEQKVLLVISRQPLPQRRSPHRYQNSLPRLRRGRPLRRDQETCLSPRAPPLLRDTHLL